ncbi:hypothetical protein KIPE111705_46475 [Kibdelosporangium persicum]
MPARSTVSQAISSTSRCWGSIASASRGEIPKKPASNPATSSRKPPSRAYDVPARAGSGSCSRTASQPRSDGNGEIASTPSTTSRQRSSGVRTPPGYRQPIATTAIGSPSTGAVMSGAATAIPSPRTRMPTYRASAMGVGWSNTRVAGSVIPAAELRRSRSRTAVRESKPISRKARSAATSPADEWPSTTAAWFRTNSSSTRARSSSPRPASRRPSGEVPASATPGSASSTEDVLAGPVWLSSQNRLPWNG